MKKPDKLVFFSGWLISEEPLTEDDVEQIIIGDETVIAVEIRFSKEPKNG